MMRLAQALMLFAIVALPLSASADGENCKRHAGGDWFSEMDTDHDGTISKDEFRTMTDKQFDEMDADHDGTVSKQEMMSCKRMKGHMMMKKDSK
jgi:Ca2+-binding EF-hand superfamily protein